MIERDPMERQLMLARTATWAPDAAKARVRANLAGGGTLFASGGARAAGVKKLTTALLVGASFVAGYLLGVQRSVPALGLPRGAEPREPAVVESESGRTPERATLATSATQEGKQSPAPAPSLPEPIAADAPATQATAPSPTRPPPRAAPGHRHRATPGRATLTRAPAAPSDAATEELLLLSRTERAIRAGEPLLALSFLAELDARFPSSTMLEERATAHLLAECALSNPGARRRAELFLNDRAASVYTDRVRRACGLDAPATPASSASSQAADGSSKSGH